MILYTADRLAGFIARRTGPAHSGLAPHRKPTIITGTVTLGQSERR